MEKTDSVCNGPPEDKRGKVDGVVEDDDVTLTGYKDLVILVQHLRC